MPFRIALSGLNAASADLKATGNNIANASTTGFKTSRTEFVDVFAVGSGGISSTAIGGGVRLAAVTQQFSQGNIDFTDNNLDLAINGEGFFILSDAGTRLLSRAGSFQADNNGFITNSSGHRLQAFPATVTTAGTTFDTGRLTDLQLSTSEGLPQATDLIGAGVNLNASDVAPTAAFDPDLPDSYNRSTSLIVYDSLGAEHTATQYFRKIAPNSWEVYMRVDGEQVPGLPAADRAVTLTFTNQGALDVAATDADPLNTAAPAVTTATAGVYTLGGTTHIATSTGAAELNISFDVNDMTQLGSSFSVGALTQDGFSTGRLTGIDIDAEGVISARFSNGQSQILGKVALGNVANPQGLSPQGDTIWGETFTAGTLILGEAGTSSFGLMQSGALEASNVDIAGQLVNLITAQRNYQANAQVISAADTVTQTIINIR